LADSDGRLVTGFAGVAAMGTTRFGGSIASLPQGALMTGNTGRCSMIRGEKPDWGGRRVGETLGLLAEVS
jgi:hypothetical protein